MTYSPTTKCSSIGAPVFNKVLNFSWEEWFPNAAKRIAGRRRKQKYFCLPPCKYSRDTPNTKKTRNSFARIPLIKKWRWQCGATARLATKETLVSRRNAKGCYSPTTKCSTIGATDIDKVLNFSWEEWFPNAIKRIAGWIRHKKKRNSFARIPLKKSGDDLLSHN